MNKNDFFKILCTYTPEELNKFISQKGVDKPVPLAVSIEDLPQEEIDALIKECDERIKEVRKYYGKRS